MNLGKSAGGAKLLAALKVNWSRQLKRSVFLPLPFASISDAKGTTIGGCL
jgi:hypothetical protein